MRKLSLFLFLSALYISLNSCSAVKSYTKAGDRFAAAGLYDDAVYNYKMALANDLTYIKARVGLKSTGQKVLDQALDKFSKAHINNNLRDAVYAYISAKKIYDEIQSFRIELNMPEMYKSDFEEDKAEFLAQLYDQANQFMKKKQFSQAESTYDELLKLQPDYKDAAKLRSKAFVIENYNEARAAYDAQDFRTAYLKLKTVVAKDASYQDATTLMADAKDKATLTIAFAPLECKREDRDDANAIVAQLIAQISSENNEFIALIDRSNTDRILSEQKINLQNSASITSAGELMGAKVLFTGKIISYTADQTPIRQVEKKGYEAYTEKVFKKELNAYVNQQSYRKVTYTEASGSYVVNLKLQYQLVSTENGKILRSGVVTKEVRDDVNYASYSGNASALYPGVWNSSYSMDPRDVVWFGNYRNLQQKLSARREFRSENDMLSEVQTNACNDIVNSILDYEKNRQ